MDAGEEQRIADRLRQGDDPGRRPIARPVAFEEALGHPNHELVIVTGAEPPADGLHRLEDHPQHDDGRPARPPPEPVLMGPPPVRPRSSRQEGHEGAYRRVCSIILGG